MRVNREKTGETVCSHFCVAVKGRKVLSVWGSWGFDLKRRGGRVRFRVKSWETRGENRIKLGGPETGLFSLG